MHSVTFVLQCALMLGYCSGLRMNLEKTLRFGSRPSRLASRSPIQLDNDADELYSTNITLGGQNFTVAIDYGSSDLWVTGPVTDSIIIDGNASFSRTSNGLEATIKAATLQWGEHLVHNQSFIEIKNGSSEDMSSVGLLGFGPSPGSEILHIVNSSAGETVLNNIFRSQPSDSSFFSFRLGREDVASTPFSGEMTIGEVLPGFEDVLNQPKIPVTTWSTAHGQHWSIQLDKDGIVGPDGKSILFTPFEGSQATVILDTGFTLPQVSKSVADAIYGSVAGARFANLEAGGDVWVVPCDQELNISFNFEGKSFPVHPLDAVFVDRDDNECIGSFQPTILDPSSVEPIDFVFGMAFLRNVYFLLNTGDPDSGVAPYVQFLSTTNDSAQAHQQFLQARPPGTRAANASVSSSDVSGNAAIHRGSPAFTSLLPSQSNESQSQKQTLVKSAGQAGKAGVSKGQIVGIVCGVVGLLVVLVGAAGCCASRKDRGGLRFIPGGAYTKLERDDESLIIPFTVHQSRTVEPSAAATSPTQESYKDTPIDDEKGAAVKEAGVW